MTIASILVAVDLEPSARERLRLAGHLADAFGSGLIGVAADEPPYGVPPVGPTLGSTYALAAASEMVMNDLTRAHAVFEAEIGRDRRRAWRSNLGPSLPFLIAQAAAEDEAAIKRAEAATRRVLGWTDAAKRGCAELGRAGDRQCEEQLLKDAATYSIAKEGHEGVIISVGTPVSVAVDPNARRTASE